MIKEQSDCLKPLSCVVEKPQLMGGDDAPPESFVWTIKRFSKLPGWNSEIFNLGGIGWRLSYSKGWSNRGSLSLRLYARDEETISKDGWSIDAQFSITVVNQIDDKFSVEKATRHRFNERETSSVYIGFMPLIDLYDPAKGYLVNDTCIIEVTVSVKSVVPPKKITDTQSKTQTPSLNEGSSVERVLHIDPVDSAKVTRSKEPPKQIDVSPVEKFPAKGHAVIEEQTRSERLNTLFSRIGLLKLRNPPYSLPNGHRITEGAVLGEGDLPAQLIQSALLSSELQSLVEMPVGDLTNKGYYHLAQFLHYHCASIVSAQGLQIKHQENANVLEEIERRDLEIQKLQLSLGKSTQEASQLREDLDKVKEEKVKVEDEFSVAKEKIIDLEGELQLLRSENVDLQIQLEDAWQAERNAS